MSTTMCDCGHPLRVHPKANDGLCTACDCTGFLYGGKPLDGADTQTGAGAAPNPSRAAAPTYEQILAAARRSTLKRTTALGERIEEMLLDLRHRLADEREAAEERRRAEATAAAARAEVDRLEKQLAAAREKAKMPKTKAARAAGDKTCPDCGQTGFSNIGVHRFSKHGVRTTT